MCIAIMNPSTVTLKKKTIRTCWDNNYNGAGMLYINSTTNKLETFKEMTSFDRYYKAYQDIRKAHPKSKVILHFRIATHGIVNEDNCHPFMVSDNLGFVHNGIIQQAPHSQLYSDTYMFNESYLKKLPDDFISNPIINELIAEFIGYSKLVFLDADNNHTIINEQDGVWDAGCWFSNRSYMPTNYIDFGGKKIRKTDTASTAKPVNYGTYYHRNSWYNEADWDVDNYNKSFGVEKEKEEDDEPEYRCECCEKLSHETYSGLAYHRGYDSFLCADCEWDLENEFDDTEKLISIDTVTTKTPF